MVRYANKRNAVENLQEHYPISERRSCSVLRINRSAYRRKPTRDEQAFLRMRIKDIASARIRYGYRRIHVLLQRVYKEEGLNLRSKAKRKAIRAPEKAVAQGINECWAMDFVSDQLFNVKRFWTLTILDMYSCECLNIYVNKASKGETAASVLNT